MRFIFTCTCLFLFTQATFSQIVVSGNVLDKSKLNYVEGVRVFTTAGKIAITDSIGHYSILANKGDSIYFVYNAKPTQKFAVNTLPNQSQFDISLHLNVKSNYTLLKEVTVYSKNYKQDSAENRSTYAEVFNYHKPRLETSTSTFGAVGFDANELFNLFRPKWNKRMQKLQAMVVFNEEQQYISYRFNKNFVRRVTQLNGASLDTFMVWYRPSYYFASTSSDISFNQYVLNASYQFRRLKGETVPPSFPQSGELPKPNKERLNNVIDILKK